MLEYLSVKISSILIYKKFSCIVFPFIQKTSETNNSIDTGLPVY